MRISLDPVPLVIGIYAYVGELLEAASERRDAEGAEALGRRFGRQREGKADRDIQKLLRALHAGVKTADKLLKKTGDVWKISRETDLVNLVVQPRGSGEDPRAYVLLRTEETRAILRSIRAAAAGAGEDEEVLEELDAAANGLDGRAGDYYTFGFDPF